MPRKSKKPALTLMKAKGKKVPASWIKELEEDHPEVDDHPLPEKDCDTCQDPDPGPDPDPDPDPDPTPPEPQEILKRSWRSGDYKEDAKGEPTAGVGIDASLILIEMEDTGQVIIDSMKVEFFDYTSGGGTSVIPDLTTSEFLWTEIPPAKGADPVNPTGKDFSLSGHVKIQQEPNGSFLRVRFSYATDKTGSTRRDERGFVLGLDIVEAG